MRLKCHPLQSPVSENGTQRGQLTRGGQTAPAGKNFFFFARAKDVLVQGEFQTAFSFPAFLLQHNTALLSFHFKSWVENICAGACGLLCSCPKPSWGSLGDVKASCLSAGFIPCICFLFIPIILLDTHVPTMPTKSGLGSLHCLGFGRCPGSNSELSTYSSVDSIDLGWIKGKGSPAGNSRKCLFCTFRSVYISPPKCPA